MDGANKRFIHGKKEWLENHLILYKARGGMANPFQDPVTPTENKPLPIYSFDLRKIASVTDGSGKEMKAYELHVLEGRKTHWSTHAIRAYFLPWGSNSSYHGRLGSDADFFFTPTMNGCSFAAQGANEPVVTHSNHVDEQQIDQGRIDQDLQNIYQGVGGPDRTLKRNDYKPTGQADPEGPLEDYMVTLVGIRSGTGWDFLYQRYKTGLQNKPGGGTSLVQTALDRRVQL
jgi:hypothetical protein